MTNASPAGRRSSRLGLTGGVVALALALATTASAQTKTAKASAPNKEAVVAPVPVSEAARIFEQGKALYAEGRYEQACKKFEESKRIRPGVGTDFHLANCWERTGRVASAQALFLDVAKATYDLGQHDRSRAARERADALAPRVSRLVIMSRQVEGLEVRQNGVVVTGIDVGKAFPIDPGEYEISLSARGKRAWTTKIHVPRNEPSVFMVELPKLEEDRQLDPLLIAPATAPVIAKKPPPPAPLPPPPPEQQSKYRQGATIALAGAGVLGLIVGGSMLSQAVGSNQDAEAVCPDSRECTAGEIELHNELMHDARVARNWAIVGMATGALALTTATYLYVTRAKQQEKAAKRRSLEPSAILLPSEGIYGAALRGRF